MPRPLRKNAQGCTHHVYTRCHGKRNLLLGRYGKQYFRKGLSRDPRMNDIGFINCYLDKNYTCQIKIIVHSFFLNRGSSFEDCVENFLFYEEAYCKRLAVYFDEICTEGQSLN